MVRAGQKDRGENQRGYPGQEKLAYHGSHHRAIS
jgi:hypothetical protein